ncbi:hypothetical protein MACK_002296 [Theileria orientalis]|uniref:Uncharacterized protein n=1 Tax=Theileria orientalis TaxID=68886 RepID=A0A976QX16_THEOR|nr:hypothetical protein MACK_002296 [Theileria orientalis]
MYTYKLYVVFIYLLSSRWYVCAPEPGAATTKTNVTFDLRNLKKFENVTEETPRYEVKNTTFTTPTDKVVEKVVYDNVDVWVASEHAGKTLTKLVVTEKRNLLQLVDVVLVNSTGDPAQEEHKYYKKQKKEFTVVEAEEYKKLKGFVSGRLDRYSDLWFLYDFGNKDSYSRFVGQKNYLLDGVWKTTFAPYQGKALLLRDGTQVLWTHANDDKYLTSVDLFEFDADKLLVLNFGDVEAKYFHKPKTELTEWKTLESETVFNTKANEFKTRYFTTALEHDLAKKPDYNKFWVNRTPVYGNLSELNLNPTRTYLFNKVKFGDQVVWSSDKKENRVYAMKLTLLGYDVKTVQLVVTKGNMSLNPTYDVLYYHKDASEKFQTKNKEEYKDAVKEVKAAADRVKAFTYVDTWLQKGSRLDVANYNKAEFTVETAEGTEGVVTETLTPKDNMWFASVGFGTVDVWPATGVEVNNPVVKKVVLVKKNSLLQLVHLTVSGTSTAAHADATEVEHYFKKNGDTFVALAGLTNFNEEKSKLDGKGVLLDPYVHLDVNTAELNKPYYTVATETVDGVDKKVVTVNTLKVTKLKNFAAELWTKPSDPQDAHVKGFEVYTVADKKLLKLLVNEGTPDTNTKFEKTGENTQWTPLTENFNAKLLAFKAPDSWAAVELDVAVSPSLTDFDVVVTALKGNRTKLVLTPKKMKKVTKVKLGANKEFFATAESNRAYKVELYLETYEAKFVKVYVWKDVATTHEHLLTDVKQFKEGANWVSDNFDKKLEAFLAEENTVPFTYSENWVQPPTTFDPKSFSATYFGTEDATADLVKTTTYTARPGTAVNKVLLYGDKVWPEGDTPDTTKKLVEMKVLSKNDMVQLVHLKNALVATPTTTEDLYYKKATDRYVKLDLTDFDKLKASLSTADEYVDDKVKLDLSAAETSTKLFEKETTLEDGVEKTVVVVKAGKLFEVSASPALWKSNDGSYVTKLERYALDDMQLLVLHITKPDRTTETKYFEKPISPPVAAPPEPGQSTSVDPARPEVPPAQEGPERPAAELPDQVPAAPRPPEAQVHEQRVQQEVLPPVAPAKPSFEALNDKAAFFAKLNTAKATVVHENVSLDVKAYNEPAKYEVREAREGNATLYKVYPKKPYRVTGLVNGTANNLWTDRADGERLVEAFFYVHEEKVKFVRAVVWAKDHTDESKDKLLHFKLENDAFVPKEADVFAKELREVTTVPLTPLATETVVQPDPTPLSFRKFYLSDQVDTDVFELTERKKGAYKLKNYKPKQDMFVNLVETQHGVLWKASNVGDFMKSTFFAVTDNSALAHLTVLVNSLPTHLFFKFEKDSWARLDSSTYVDLYTKAGLTSASS